MIWSIITIGTVGGIGAAIGYWRGRKVSTDRFVDPIQRGTFFRQYWDDVTLDQKKSEAYSE